MGGRRAQGGGEESARGGGRRHSHPRASPSALPWPLSLSVSGAGSLGSASRRLPAGLLRRLLPGNAIEKEHRWAPQRHPGLFKRAAIFPAVGWPRALIGGFGSAARAPPISCGKKPLLRVASGFDGIRYTWATDHPAVREAIMGQISPDTDRKSHVHNGTFAV